MARAAPSSPGFTLTQLTSVAPGSISSIPAAVTIARSKSRSRKTRTGVRSSRPSVHVVTSYCAQVVAVDPGRHHPLHGLPPQILGALGCGRWRTVRFLNHDGLASPKGEAILH